LKKCSNDNKKNHQKKTINGARTHH